MGRRIDISGQRYGKITVLSFERVNLTCHTTIWRCRCDCGRELSCQANNLKSGNTESCGCVHGVFVSDPLTHEILLKLIHYDPKSGIVTRRVDGKNCLAGDQIGFVDTSTGYMRVTVEGEKFYVHILAWWYMTGVRPAHQIDHRDRNRENNKWINLRDATQTQQNANRTKEEGKLSRYKGVTRLQRGKKAWHAQIGNNGKNFNLGQYEREIDAAFAYDRAARRLYGEYAHTNFGEG